ncbi:MAG: hypothetical protein JXB88_07345 [Spirochaetales bacterium]|nr:hypothetical protein [Spirochaetales bacterium]
MDIFYELKFIYSLLLTLVVEIPCLLFCVRLLFKKDKRNIPIFSILWTGFLASFTTLPYIWFILPAFIRTYLYYTITAELFAFGMEAIIYRFLLNLPLRRTIIISFICNSTSFLCGELIKEIIKL